MAKNMLVSKCIPIKRRIKGIVVIDYINATIYQQITIKVCAIRITNHLIKPIYLGQQFAINMRKIG